MSASDLHQAIHDLDSPDAAVRVRAAQNLATRGAEARPAATALVVAAGDPEESVAQWATEALEQLGPAEAGDVGRLARLLTSPAEATAYWAATLLGRLEAGAAPAVASLTAALEKSPHPAVRQRAAWALGEIGPSARSAGGALRAAAEDADPRLARLARRALDAFDRKP